MKSRIYLSMAVLVALAVGFGLGYRSGYTHASKPRVIFERDTADGRTQGSAKVVYEPYFSQNNRVPAQATR
jgi:hypothetical protein